MTVFVSESSSTANDAKDSAGDEDWCCNFGETMALSLSTLADLSTEFTFRASASDKVAAADSESEDSGEVPSKSGSALGHDHPYCTLGVSSVRSSAAVAGAKDIMDDSLQSLFDTCEMDIAFLAKTQSPAYRRFLDDVMGDQGDVTADDDDDLFPLDFELDVRDVRAVPTRSSPALGQSASLSAPCLFTCAGSNLPVLSTSLPPPSPSSSSLSPPIPFLQPSFFPASTLSSLPHSCSKPTSDSNASESSALDSKLKDVIDFLFSSGSENSNDVRPSPKSRRVEGGDASSSSNDVSAFLQEMSDVSRPRKGSAHGFQPLSSSGTADDDWVWPVTMAHRIQDGVCVSCDASRRVTSPSSRFTSCRSLSSQSATCSSNSSFLVTSSSSTTITASSASSSQSQQTFSLSSSSSSLTLPSSSLSSPLSSVSSYTTTSSVSSSTVASRKRSHGNDVIVDAKRSRVAMDTNAADCLCDASDNSVAANKIKGDVVLDKRSEGVLDYLSFVRSSKLPLSPIHLQQFGRHG